MKAAKDCSKIKFTIDRKMLKESLSNLILSLWNQRLIGSEAGYGGYWLLHYQG